MFSYHPAADLLKNKIILVTGAGSGLGQAAARAYASHGATVLLLGRNEQTLEVTYDSIEAAGGPTPALFVLDLETAGEDQYNELANIIDQEFGRLDGLLHNAGAFSPQLPLEHHSMETWERLIKVNLTAGFGLSKSCLPLLKKAPDASLIFTSSRAGRELRAYWGPYNIAKHGVENLATIFYQELQNTSRIRVNTLNPGPCATALRKVGFPTEDPSTLPKPDDLMALYLYLMGDESLHESGGRFDAQ